MVEVAQHNDFLMGDGTDFGGNLRGASIDMLSINNTTSAGMDDVDKLLQAFQPGQGSFDLPHELTMDWNMNVELPASLPAMPAGNGGVPGLLQPASIAQPQPFAGPVSRLGWASNSPVPTAALPGQQNCGPPLSSSAGAAGLSGHHMGSPPEHGPMSQPPLHPFAAQGEQQGLMKPQFPAMPRSARRASVPATAPGGVSTFVSNTLYETRSSPPLWTIGEGEVDGSPGIHGGMRPALSADANTAANMTRGMDGASSAAGRRLRQSVRSASVGANSERPLSSADLDLGLSGAKAKERNRRAQKRFRERQKVKQQEAVQRVVQLEDALDRLEVERSELSQKLEAMAHVRGGGGGGHGEMSGAAKAEDSGSEQQMQSPASSQERVLTLSVPAGRERHLTGSDIKKLTWPEYISLYESYLEEMAAMLLQAQGNGDSPAGHRLQRLCTELITVTAAMLMHDPTTKGRLHCMPLMSQPVSTPLAPPDSNFWHRVTMALCLSPQQRQNCLRLRNAHLHKVRDILQDRYRINDMMQSTLPSYDFELQAARQHLRALQVSENLQRNLRQEQGLQLELSTTFFSQALTPIQMATAATESYPWWPDILAMLNATCEGME